MNISITIDERKIKELIAGEINRQLGDARVATDDVMLYVKSKKNYRLNEWEACYLRASNDDTDQALGKGERVVARDGETRVEARVRKFNL